jgi:short-subunit dehydrogenase
MLALANKTVLITGASMGVGRACAERFFKAGANVALLARQQAPLLVAAQALGDPSRVLTLAADVNDVATLQSTLKMARDRFGGLHVLVNNAGAHFRGPVEKRTSAELATMVDVNLRAPIVLTRLVLPLIRQSGGGAIVNVASLAGKIPLEGAATYSATKFGLRAFTHALAQELRGSGVSTSVVSPGPIDTHFIMDHLDEVADISFSQKVCTAEDVAEMVFACARDGRLEREFPKVGAKLATLGYVLPALRRMIKPALARKGRRQKERLRKERTP